MKSTASEPGLRKVSKACLVKNFFNLTGKYFDLGFNKIGYNTPALIYWLIIATVKLKPLFLQHCTFRKNTESKKKKKREKGEKRKQGWQDRQQ